MSLSLSYSFVLKCAQLVYFQLYASVLAKEPLSLEKAKTLLEKAIKMDTSYLEPVYIMADILAQQHHYDKGIEL